MYFSHWRNVNIGLIRGKFYSCQNILGLKSNDLSIHGLFLTQGSNLHLLCLLPWWACSLPLCHLGSPFFEAGCWTFGQGELSLRNLGENLCVGDGRAGSGVVYTSHPCTGGPGPLSSCGRSDPGGEQRRWPAGPRAIRGEWRLVAQASWRERGPHWTQASRAPPACPQGPDSKPFHFCFLNREAGRPWISVWMT